MKARLIAAVLMAALAPAAARADPSYTPALQRCLDSAAGASTLGQTQCVAAELKVQDARLNHAYGKVMGLLNPRQQGKLRAAQRAWIAYRDADCLSRYDEDWGSLSQINANFCVLEKTADRAEYLAAYPEQ